jgi:hypothetical protein
MFGAYAHIAPEVRKHFPRLFAVLVGETSKGRKGSALANVRHVLGLADPEWSQNCVNSGLSSGEGLIHAVRDPVMRKSKNEEGETVEKVEDEGVSDKRLLITEEEFGSVLKMSLRDGNVLSDQVRRAWDTGDLASMTKRSPARATGAHVSILGHITRADLQKHLAENDALNGFGNRILWCAVRRSKLLPDGGKLAGQDVSSLVLRLRQAVGFAKGEGEMQRTPAAGRLWHKTYPELSSERPGLIGAITSRSEAQAMRLALVYALLDCSRQIDVAHLEAGLAVWRFCDDSAKFIFGESLGDRLADRILDALRRAGVRGMTRSELRAGLLGNNTTTAKLDAALAMLQRLKLAAWTKEMRPGAAGRPAVLWRACRPVDPAAAIASAQPPEDLPASPSENSQPRKRTVL